MGIKSQPKRPSRRDSYAIIIKIVDANGKPVFTWRPGSNNVALGLRKGIEIAQAKGLDKELQEEGIILIDKKENDSNEHPI